jgi:hypothetical protein
MMGNIGLSVELISPDQPEKAESNKGEAVKLTVEP